MTFTESISTCFKKYADFTGCAPRSEYWWWVLFCILGSVATSLVSDVLSGLFTLATLLPSIAAAARRLHDTDRSGWMQLIGLIPLVGTILVIVWYCQQTKRPTRFLGESLSLEKA